MGGQSHTAGPWTATSDGTHHYHIMSKPYAVGTLHALDHPGINGPANARLIAAAPELSAELAEARVTLSILRTQIMVEIGRCADPRESRWDGVPEKLKERLDGIDAVIAKATGAEQ